VYSADLVRQGEAFSLDLGALRSLAPTGFAYLTLQQGVNANANYAFSERWSYSAGASWQTNTYPAIRGGDSFDRRYYNVAVSAKWRWTEQWALTLQANKVVQVYGSPSVSGASTGVNLEISRQFFRKDL
jgi:outer membrane protein assembly factor BamA